MKKENHTEKICKECGAKIEEQRESMLYECERCIGRYEE
ncbi:protein YhfH [Sporosarcina sp. 179-K 3D1 HS]